ncbi:hypothetical protein BH23PLA1_BH23PLA1_10760 [soil metagenome]
MIGKFLDPRRNPLANPKSLGSSLIFHAALLLLASVAAMGAISPVDRGPKSFLPGEIEPVDNRVPREMDGGGGPGELGGTLRPDQIRIAADGQADDSRAVPDPAADALLEEILPVQPAPDPSTRALPGPIDLGIGVLPAPGSGGGGGEGGGSGGGQGRGLGAGAEFFGARDRASSFVYVIDRSNSMTNRNSMEIAKGELWASLSRLPADAEFGIVFYNERATPFTNAQGQARMMPATQENKSRVQARLQQVQADGGTNHIEALRAGFAMKPEVIFFLTDADDMNDREAERLARESGPIRIQAIEFGIGPDSGLTVPLRALAQTTGGSYRYIDVMTFPTRNPTAED